MKLTNALIALTLITLPSTAAVKLTALQIISTETNGKIQGVGAHRFKTANHGGQPAIFVVDERAEDAELRGLGAE